MRRSRSLALPAAAAVLLALLVTPDLGARQSPIGTAAPEVQQRPGAGVARRRRHPAGPRRGAQALPGRLRALHEARDRRRRRRHQPGACRLQGGLPGVQGPRSGTEEARNAPACTRAHRHAEGHHAASARRRPTRPGVTDAYTASRRHCVASGEDRRDPAVQPAVLADGGRALANRRGPAVRASTARPSAPMRRRPVTTRRSSVARRRPPGRSTAS